MSSVSGGGVSTWTKAVSFAGSVGADEEIWYGKVTTTGSSTITFTWSSSITGHIAEYGVEEFSAGLGASTVWATDKTGTVNDASSTSVALPSLTPSTSGELYFGYSVPSPTPHGRTTSGFTYAVTTESNVVAYDPTSRARCPRSPPSHRRGPPRRSRCCSSASSGAPPPPPTVTGVSPSARAPPPGAAP